MIYSYFSYARNDPEFESELKFDSECDDEFEPLLCSRIDVQDGWGSDLSNPKPTPWAGQGGKVMAGLGGGAGRRRGSGEAIGERDKAVRSGRVVVGGIAFPPCGMRLGSTNLKP